MNKSTVKIPYNCCVVGTSELKRAVHKRFCNFTAIGNVIQTSDLQSAYGHQCLSLRFLNFYAIKQFVAVSVCLTVCLSVSLSVYLFPQISVSFTCMGLTFCRCPRGPMGIVHKLKKFPGGYITKEPMWTSDVDDVTQNNCLQLCMFSTIY